MNDFHLSQALERHPESGATGFCSCEAMGGEREVVKCPSVLQGGGGEEVVSLEQGVDLVISQQPLSLQRVANLVVLLNRMRKTLTSCQLSDEPLCSVIMETLVDETVVKKVQDLTMCEGGKTFRRIDSRMQCSLCDMSQKDVVQPPGDMELQAITLKGGSCYQRVSFKMAKYISSTGESQTITLSILKTNLHMSCHMKEDRAVLHLEECCTNKLKTINSDEDQDRFLFYKRTTGISLTTFESVKYRGWFISTSSEDEQRLEMCKVDAATRLTNFKVI